MAYTATALTRTGESWSGRDVELDDVEDLDAAADLLRDLAPTAGVALLFVEEDDDYVGIVRVDGDDEPRALLSDQRAVGTYALAERLFGDVVAAQEVLEDDDLDEDSPRPEALPAGDTGLLEDLGTPARVLLDLLAEEGMLPSDVVYALCERAGCVEVLEAVRGGV